MLASALSRKRVRLMNFRPGRGKSHSPLSKVYWLNYHHEFFLKRLFHGEKMTFKFAFDYLEQPYGIVPFTPASVGMADKDSNGHPNFCGNTLAQVCLYEISSF